MRSLVRWLGVVSTLGMFVVLVMGATVTNTGSEHGCGRSWPLCHGQLIPQFAVATFIELSHRAVAGVESVLIIALAIGALYLYWNRLEIRVLAPLMLAFLFLQAGLGAWAVMAPQLAFVLALHFGVSLIAFASVFLTTAVLFEMRSDDAWRDSPIPSSLRRYAWAVIAYSYVVVYLGAYVRHIDADEACSGWPLCNGAVIPTWTHSVAAAFTHRIAAGLLAIAILALALWIRPLRASRPDLWRASLLAIAMVALQALSGAIVVLSHLSLFSALAHAAAAGLLFGSLSYVCLRVTVRSRQAEPLSAPASQGTSPDGAMAREVAAAQR